MAPIALAATDRPGSGPLALVLLHGLTQQRAFWDPVVRRICADPSHPRVVSVDLRGHGDSGDTPVDRYNVPVCAEDVVALLDRLGIEKAVLAGHSWGGWVAVEAAAAEPGRVAGLVALDGGFTRLADLGDRAQVRERLTPPALGVPLDDLMEAIAHGSLAPWWSEEVRDALLPTFSVGDDGLARTRLGMERHLQVLDGALDYDPVPALGRITCPAWLVLCEALSPDDPQTAARVSAGVAALDRATALLAQPRVQRWAGALHDVPLQWPWLVAGLLRACVDEAAAPRPDGGSA